MSTKIQCVRNDLPESRRFYSRPYRQEVLQSIQVCMHLSGFSAERRQVAPFESDGSWHGIVSKLHM